MNDTTLRAAFERHFNRLKPEQLMLLVKLCKLIRSRGRSSTAFNYCFKELFPYARFEQVTRISIGSVCVDEPPDLPISEFAEPRMVKR